MMKPAAAKTFDEYAQQVFIPYISSQLRNVSRVTLVWDTYNDNSLKGTARAKRGNGIRRYVVGKAALPGNWQNFLRIDSNKRELFSFRRSIRKTSKLSSPLGRGCSAHSHCRMSTPCRHAALKKLIVVCYCM